MDADASDPGESGGFGFFGYKENEGPPKKANPLKKPLLRLTLRKGIWMRE